MSLKRFKVIMRVLRFDDKNTRSERRERDKLAPIRTVFDKWANNLKVMYSPYANVTVDEQLLPFRGRCPFIQYIPKKPAKYGIKLWALCDSTSYYAWNMQVYTGRDRNCRPEVNKGQRVVLDLVDNLVGRNVTCDNFFTSHSLAVELKKRRLTLLGTVRKNKKFLPPYIIDMKGQPPTTSRFVFDHNLNATIVSYVPKKNRLVLLMSTLHHDKKISDKEHKKPEMILDYNKTKCGVDTLDQLIGTYTCKRKVNRWPVAVFCNMLDVSACNAYVIFKEIIPKWNIPVRRDNRRLFLLDLCAALVLPYVKSHTAKPRGSNAGELFHQLKTGVIEPPPACGCKRGRCQLCPNPGNTNVHSNICGICHKFVCNGHHTRFTICSRCDENQV